MAQFARFDRWVKKLGPTHFVLPGKYETLCGIPMLGNNYWKIRTDQYNCEKCLHLSQHTPVQD